LNHGVFTNDYFVLSQCTRLTGRQTDGQTVVDSRTVQLIMYQLNVEVTTAVTK